MSDGPSDAGAAGGAGEEETGLPLFRSWQVVYAVVLVFFVLLVTLLTLFTRAYA